MTYIVASRMPGGFEWIIIAFLVLIAVVSAIVMLCVWLSRRGGRAHLSEDERYFDP